MNKTTNWPATVRELGEMAANKDLDASAMLAELEAQFGPCPMPPTGYTLESAKSGRWIGTETMNRSWILTPGWKFDTGHCIDVWTVDYRDLTPTEALQLGTALIQAAQTAGVTEGE
ncbi:hypothetical protein GU243_02435 [Pseudarthrobacter psychrotolerans]|uniref:Uncharacterized protein n=1 Tax=Pseudarthrobacter psychrotolerans TaxID=2697569 RepID=A0A6P1NPW5_9MICC|nr:hypothetical protein [Pseudarthrobacter psychrotolerans]QHK18821.1 hypothetical protein GU243_02435 [Pseudarthrobacter psychrotolerans]